jgi:hypothetical protein
MPQLEIRQFRLSNIWVETLPDLFTETLPTGTATVRLGSMAAYEERFGAALADGPAAPLQPPWGGRSGLGFWKCYLGLCKEGVQDRIETVNQGAAWRHLVPLRTKVPLAIQAPWLSGRVETEGFFYPYGVGLMVTAVVRAPSAAPFSLDQAVELAFAIRTKPLTVRWSAGGSTLLTEAVWGSGDEEQLKIGEVANRALATLRAVTLGPHGKPGKGPASPFTIFTVIQCDGVDPSQPTLIDGDVHRALQAVTTWSTTYDSDSLLPFHKAGVVLRQLAPKSHLLYSTSRGRAVWFPASFRKSAEAIHSLGCFHRNLSFESMQVESLSGLLRQTAPDLGQTKLPGDQLACLRFAAGVLGRLYGGASVTYQSCSSRVQIEQNKLTGVLSQARKWFGMQPLATGGSPCTVVAPVT